MEPVNLIVAKAHIAGGIMLEREAPAQVRMRAGDEVLVKFVFRFDELSKEREDYGIVLRTSIDGEPSREERFEGRDRRALDDGRRGFLVQRHRILASGTHTLSFQAQVRLAQSDWESDDADFDEAEIDGQVQLIAT